MRSALAIGITLGLTAILDARAVVRESQPSFDHGHAEWTKVLATYQNPVGLVNYAGLKADLAKDPVHPFGRYVTSIQSVSSGDFEKWTDNQKKAFLINAYNALTVKLIVDHYPVKSIKKIGGIFRKPWSLEFFSLLGGKIRSLDPIEHDWLRPKFKDFRIHAAVNCASISCPPLRHEAFVADRLDEQLDGQMRAWLTDSQRNALDSSKRVFTVSKIFDWYKKDFEEWGGGVVAVINRYLKTPLSREVASQVKVKYLGYDWGLNEFK